MAIISRQTGLLAVENWTKIYQTFREADFTSYDFETLRKSMIDYIKLYYPENFNDFTESSEFIALIDLIAFLGQSLAFRTDLNARENFLDTAERRDSILKLAKLISYNPKRSIPASGYLKVDSVSTTENILDSNGINLSNLTINWDDPANDNWLEQFTSVINAGLIESQIVGRPGNSQTLNDIVTEEYSINLIPNIIPVFRYEASIEGKRVPFEVTSATSIGQSYVYESAPDFNRVFNLLYRNDNNGNGSNNTGYFFYFKQGELASIDFEITEAVPNKVVNIDVNNINNSDVWLYSLNASGSTKDLWKQVPSTAGINVIYNKESERNLFQVNTRAADQISLVFGDGSFANIPQGNFRLFYRTGNGASYKIAPEEMRSVGVSFNYISRSNRIETITFRTSLKYTVSNATVRETSDNIRQKAPQQYYTQNRMITGEDYNILPYTSFSKIVKAKAINRTSAGLSRYLDMLDTTGKYSSTNTFGQDGVIYANNYTKTFNFGFVNAKEIQKIIYNDIIGNIIAGKEMMHHYYAQASTVNAISSLVAPSNFVIGRTYLIRSLGASPLFTQAGSQKNEVGFNFVATNQGSGTGSVSEAVEWNLSTTGNNSCTGYFSRTLRDTVPPISEPTVTPYGVSTTAATNGKYLRSGAVIKFVAPAGFYFNPANTLVPGQPTGPEDKVEFFAGVTEVIGDGTNNGVGNFTNGVGPVTLNSKVPTGALIDSIIPVYKNNFSAGLVATITDLISNYRNFGLTYSSSTQSWRVLSAAELTTDTSWYLKLEFNSVTKLYNVTYKGIEYIFHSPVETSFYYDERLKVYDSKTATVIKDNVKVLKTNSLPDSFESLKKDCIWEVYKTATDVDGYTDSSRIYVTFSDTDNDGVPDDPRIFEFLVAPLTNTNFKNIYFRTVLGGNFDRYVELVLVNQGDVVSNYASKSAIETNISQFEVGQLFYATGENAFYTIVSTLAGNAVNGPLNNYVAYKGRQNLYYQYRHNSPNTRRVDPSISNIIDLYVLTSTYNAEYRQWIQDTSGTISLPVAPTNTELSVEFSELNNLKAISDTVIFQNAVFKPIFGNKAENNLQATFKVVKNPNLNISDADIKTSVINAVNTYFDVDNWDFGETFYFSELAAYLHRVLSPNIASIVIVPKDSTIKFGSLHQINAEANEIIISAATVNDIEIISAVTAIQLNQGIALIG